ncbi:hypothetical protein HID58_065528 [Brassica napus]|uniref:Retrotransposon Copia-like N-terminal domain-containing protein n=1 Tax=Brassica napus TaxID=3708 RepID=A0ABQ7ZD16_BRANA|nr:hypothetical protein HID58_065528 [Brassica napus]
MMSLSPELDPESPYYVDPDYQPNENLPMVILSQADDNYFIWKKHFLGFLRSKNKTGFIDGTVVLTEPSSPLYQPWNVCNARVKLWMMSSMSKSLQDYVRYAETAHKAWEDLRMIFVPSVDLRIRQLRQRIELMRQDGDSMARYHLYNREKAKGKAPVKSLLPIVGTKSKMEYRPTQDKRKGAVKQAVGPSPAAKIPISSGSAQPPLVDATPAGAPMLDPPMVITAKATSSPAHSEGGTRRSPTSQRPLVMAQKTSSPRNQFTPHSKSSTAEYNDLAEGGLCVDFTPYSASQNANDSSSGPVSDMSSYSGDR